MKTFKLLIASLVVFCFFFTTNVNAQKEDNAAYHFRAEFTLGDSDWFVPCAGEYIKGNYILHYHNNKNFHFYREKGVLEGVTSGAIYKFVYVDKFPFDTQGWPPVDRVWTFKIMRNGKHLLDVHLVKKDGEFKILRWDCHE